MPQQCPVHTQCQPKQILGWRSDINTHQVLSLVSWSLPFLLALLLMTGASLSLQKTTSRLNNQRQLIGPCWLLLETFLLHSMLPGWFDALIVKTTNRSPSSVCSVNILEDSAFIISIVIFNCYWMSARVWFMLAKQRESGWSNEGMEALWWILLKLTHNFPTDPIKIKVVGKLRTYSQFTCQVRLPLPPVTAILVPPLANVPPLYTVSGQHAIQSKGVPKSAFHPYPHDHYPLAKLYGRPRIGFEQPCSSSESSPDDEEGPSPSHRCDRVVNHSTVSGVERGSQLGNDSPLQSDKDWCGGCRGARNSSGTPLDCFGWEWGQ